MAGFFNLPDSRGNTKKDQRLVKKMQNPATPIAGTVTMKGSGKLVDKVQAIISVLTSKFASKKDKLFLITDEKSLSEYIDACIENNRISIDTETTGLDPILHEIVGFSIYTPGKKAAYIPINHVSYVTGLPIANQLSVDFIRDQFKRLVQARTRTYWFNAPFDVRFIGNHIGVWFTPYFDASIASRIMNSEEPVKKLKPLYIKYCCDGVGDALTFDKLFDGVPFQYIPPIYGYLYAASDALYTDELSAYYEQFLDPNGIYYEGNEGLSHVFFEIEMRSMPTFISMEQNGTAIDYDHAEKISTEYRELANKMNHNLEKICEQYKDTFDDYRRRHPMCKLTDPINFNSPVQLAIILYDVLRIEPPDKRNPRGTGEEILEKIDHPICRAILDNRSFGKVLSTYIDKLPEQAKLYPDKRIHCKFNQHGASTGRVSSNSPNLQNIPSNPFKLSDGTKIDSGHDVRQLFTASPGHILMSCDYSGQEVRVCAHLSNDKKMIQAYKDGKDVYSEIASLAFNQPYEECCEFRKDGTTNPDGKARRGQAKKIVLGRHIIAPIHSDVCRKVCEPHYSWVSRKCG